ncbi:MAG TPA: DUF378 domain-containing protein [Candidatus Paceibacterota bacterium]|nr:DUF378 domain-containing protein [Candidatus Paceibacterota bacterium]
MKSLSSIGAILMIIGALNWGLVGLGGFMGANWNVIDLLLGSWPQVEWVVYILVGIAGIMALVNWKKMMSMM